MGRVVLHVGLPKTGTSFLQGVLRENDSLLAGHGLHLPAGRPQDHFAAVLFLTDRSASWGRSPQAGRRAWRQLLAALPSEPGAVTVLSSETLCLARPRHVRRVLTDLAEHGVEQVDVVVTVRDLARQLPAEWQEGVKHGRRGSYPAFLRAVLADPAELTDPAAGQRHRRFWAAQDPVAVLDRWAADLPADRVHCVVSPPSGAAPDELWRRFATALGLADEVAAAVVIPEAQVNASLGAVQLEVLRRVNRRYTRRGREQGYGTVAKRLYAGRLLRGQQGTRLVLPAGYLDVAATVADRWVEGITTRGWRVVGDLAELRPVVPGDTEAPRLPRVTPAAMLASSVDATAGLLEEVERLTAENAALRRHGADEPLPAAGVPAATATVVRRGVSAVRSRVGRDGAA
ncbi:MAG: hypothetical protein AVDCRST_MAG36-3062 [uncultured Nocardioidaceae bacterium]|uniref:Sulfotransferase family protein n=1 Tax=uncultured Nocardioidaceae bacterium TaxID=253824 RepID=A0A6J4MQ72_9ACTN|nr:MAG: hypothetical protein AVDCRST_MAG36-3062 [uncultured Nocardioidaceae bacterium]